MNNRDPDGVTEGSDWITLKKVMGIIKNGLAILGSIQDLFSLDG